MLRKKGLMWLLVVVFLMSAVLVGCSSGGKETAGGEEKKSGPVFLNITTATTGGTYYPVGVGLATLWTDKLKKSEGISVSAQSSAGSVENVDILRNKEADLAIMQGLIGAMAWKGKGPFEGNPYNDFRSIGALWFNVEHFIVKKDLVKTGNVTDIKGMRFSIGPSGSGTERSTLTIMEGVGISTDDIKVERLGYTETAQAMKDGRLEGGSMPGGTPVAAVSDLFASPLEVQVLEFTDEQLEAINNVFPSWGRWIIKPGVYSGQDKEIKTIAQPNWLAVNKDVDEEIVYKLTKTIF
ncbi:MAG: uncharacterized protein PWQ82_942, partial [Thermosediminibacterales bacterium]|nr:uncharacterized protein [Thermosediminibacterales bacterium]